MVAVGIFNALQAWMVQPLLDEIFYRKDARLLHLLPLALLLVFFVKGLFYFAYSFILEGVGQSIIRDLRNRIYAHIHELSLSYFQNTPSMTLSFADMYFNFEQIGSRETTTVRFPLSKSRGGRSP